MKKTQIINLIKDKNPELAKDMKNGRFIGWIVLCVYITEKGNMRNPQVVIEEFCDKCYELMNEAESLQNPKYNNAVQKVTNDKNIKTPCQVFLKILKKYEKLYNMLPKWFDNQDLASEFVGFDGNFEERDE